MLDVSNFDLLLSLYIADIFWSVSKIMDTTAFTAISSSYTTLQALQSRRP
jgi:hypothetical protein